MIGVAVHDLELRQVYAETLTELAAIDNRIVVLEADLMRASGTFPFKERFPERAFDLGVAEQNMVAFAAGLAADGKIPFAATFTPFATRRALDQFAISAAYPGLPVKLVGTAPGITAELNGGTHMCFTDISRMRTMPGVIVLAPCDAADVRAAVRAAALHPGPVYLQLLRGRMPRVFGEDRKIEPGKAEVIRDGRDVTIFASGFTSSLAVEAATLLAALGVSSEIVNLTCVKPLDAETIIRSAAKTGRVVVVENASILGGIGGAVAELLSERHPVRIKRLGVRDEWGEVGPLDYLAERHRLTPRQVAEDVRAFVETTSKAAGL